MSNPPPALPYNKTNYIVPNRRVNGFIGREDVLERINVGFSLSAAPRIVVICGLGMTSLRCPIYILDTSWTLCYDLLGVDGT